MLTSQLEDSHGKPIRVYLRMNTPSGSETVSDLLALWLLTVTQGKLQLSLFLNQRPHVTALCQAYDHGAN